MEQQQQEHDNMDLTAVIAGLPLISQDFPPGFGFSPYDYTHYDPDVLDAAFMFVLREFGYLPYFMMEKLLFGNVDTSLITLPMSMRIHNAHWNTAGPSTYCQICGFPVDPNPGCHYAEPSENLHAHWRCYCLWVLGDDDVIVRPGLHEYCRQERRSTLIRYATAITSVSGM